MKYKEEFKFLNIDVREKKNAKDLDEKDKHYAILNFLDKDNTPCRFFVFKTEILEKLSSIELTALQVYDISFEVVFVNDNWNVRLIDINE